MAIRARAALLSVALLAGAGACTTDPAPAPQSAWDREQQRGGATSAPSAPGVTPVVSDFTLTPKVTDKRCFGDAGCNVEYEVILTYNGPDLSPRDTWSITYEVSGIEDGPSVGTTEMTGERYTLNQELASTSGPKKKLVITVTSVEKVGA